MHCKPLFLLCLFLGVPLLPIFGQYDWSRWDGVERPELEAEAGVLLDYATGSVLYSKNPDMPIPPASLTKLVTAHILLREVEGGGRKLSDPVELPPEAWAVNMPKGSSLMFLGPRDKATLGDLLAGLLVSSGNDAARAIALIIEGSLENFTVRMNRETAAMGFPEMYFEDAAGLSPNNSVTAETFARFCRIYIREHGNAVMEFHSMKEFTYPREENMAAESRYGSITQYNRNLLLWDYEGADGLKTGFIDESGYNLAATAERDGRRLIAVVLGVAAENHARGGIKRSEEGKKLLDFGFSQFVTLEPAALPLAPVRVWKGTEKELQLIPGMPMQITVPGELSSRLANRVEFPKDVLAPIRKGERLGSVTVFSGDIDIRTFPLVASRGIEAGNWFKRFFDSIHMFFRRIDAADSGF